MAVIGGMLDVYPGNTLAANETTYRKLEEGSRGLTRTRFNLILFAAACLAIGATIFAHLWDDYSFGAAKERVMRTYIVKHVLNNTGADITRLQIEGQAAQLDRVTGLAKLRLAHAAPGFWRYFTYGLVLVGGCAFLRLRFARWPFHPLPLLFLNTWVMSRLYFSFFLGWLIKMALTKIGGGKLFTRSKPFFIGAIMGQLTVSCLWMIVAAIYYLVTGHKPPTGLADYV